MKIALIHTSPAAINPLKKFFVNEAGYQLINFLDDGVLGLFSKGDQSGAVNRISKMINDSVDAYDVELALITCSAVNVKALAEIEKAISIPVIKIDIPMLKSALANYQSLGLVATFPPGGKESMNLVRELQQALGVQNNVNYLLVDGAYDALLAGDQVTHDNLVIEAMINNKDKVDAFILSQVSLSTLKNRAEQETGKPALSSPEECLLEIKSRLG